MRAQATQGGIIAKHPFLLIGSAFFVSLSFTTADFLYAPIYGTEAVVSSKIDTWHKGTRCVTTLSTPLGTISIDDVGKCAGYPWQVGQHPAVAIRVGRITRRLYIMPDYGPLARSRMDFKQFLGKFERRDYEKHPPLPLE